MVGYVALCILVLVSELTAFPGDFGGYADTVHHFLNRQKRQATEAGVGFNPATQKVNNTGANAFVPPGKGDQRGPCPALNVMANHNYLPHDGVATIAQFAIACNEVFRMGIDLSTGLAIYGAAVAGDGLAWSIGGPSKKVPNILNHSYGIAFSHNYYEGDSSFGRGDTYISKNDAYTLRLPLFRAFIAKKNGTNPVYDSSDFVDYIRERFVASIRQNRKFVHPIIPGLLVVPGAYHFIYRLFTNHSVEFPDGRLTLEVLKSYFAVRGSGNDLTYMQGHERIPDNWYRRSVDYGLAPLLVDIIRAGFKYPEILIPGCNNGSVNSFNAFSLEELTGGVFSLTTILQGNNLICLFLRVIEAVVEQALPIFAGVIRAISYVLLAYYGNVTGATSPIVCPAIQYNTSAFDVCPGITTMNANGTYNDAQ